jgi:DNA-binding NarL/FixJ family response regulator
LRDALRLQSELAGEQKPIGGILIDMGVVTVADVEQALRSYIQAIVNELGAWQSGEFSFELCEPRPVDDLSFVPAQISTAFVLTPQELLLEAARLSDEASALRPRSKTATRSVLGPSAVILLSTDELLRHALRPLLSRDFVLQTFGDIVALRRYMTQARREQHLIALDVDRAAEPASIAGIESLRHEFPTVPIVGFGRPDAELAAAAISAGVLTFVPRAVCDDNDELGQVQRFAQGLASVIAAGLRHHSSTELATLQECLSHLHDSTHTLRQSYNTSAVSLEVLRLIAQRVERAALLLLRPGCLMGLGAIGLPLSTTDLAKNPDRLRLILRPESRLSAALETRSLMHLRDLGGDPMLDDLFAIIGAPHRPEVVLLPLLVDERAIGLIYCDNGTSPRGIACAEALGVLAELAGLMIENLSLRRQRGEPPPAEGEKPTA